MYKEEQIKERALRCYGILGADQSGNNWNHRVINGLCRMILDIWEDWKEDTRHYQPSQRAYQRYLETVNRGESKLDPQYSDYDTALTVVKECREYLQLVVEYRVRRTCRVL